MTIDPATGSLAQDIAGQATRIQALARFMDDAEATRYGSDSGEALILKVMPPIISAP
jgi:hypothetical protein